MRVIAFTQGRSVPSARFRLRQYVSPLDARGIHVDEFWSRVGSYPPARRIERPLWAALNLVEHAVEVWRANNCRDRYDVAFLQRGFLSTYCTLEPLLKMPKVFDFDDAIFLHKRGDFVEKIVKSCSAVIAGNSFLADYVRPKCSAVFVIPTAVDVNRYRPINKAGGFVNIGWIGTSGNFKYLNVIERSIKVILDRYRDCRFMIMADRPPDFFDPGKMIFVEWSEKGEVLFLRDLDIGIMPLNDDLWVKGKCSFKMLQYMAMGLPVVVSPFGMNKDVLGLADLGFGAVSQDDWVDALDALVSDEVLRRRLGATGRKVAVEHFSVDVVVPRIEKVLKGVVRA